MCLVDGRVVSAIQQQDVNIYMKALQTNFSGCNIVLNDIWSLYLFEHLLIDESCIFG